MNNFKRNFTYYQTYKWTAMGLNAVRRAMTEMDFNEILPAILSKELEPGAFHSYAVIGDNIRPSVDSLQNGNIERQIQVTGKEAYYLPVSHNFENNKLLSI